MASLVPTFSNYLLAFGADELPPARCRAILLHCLGTKGQRISDALPVPTTQQSGTDEAAK
ncbi:hypothetical protein HPB48_019855 [Haemaphysalis longicornis]|uniref:Uncharacterized protein n=1 Tax=Haemaphysalis longicornis TaxID=44386 RepID=A0A9J6G9Q5_HAELO|nr:hypothetical protein HPB48_019855 [Haemaphysalis longicornis]